ncbi:tetrahydrofolate dehydrogenase/cyclohydrolase catalytic domain-containing protein [Chroococcidiopsis sp. CCALA 051]|uniref:tetrahydrofolate dehydrogenase/cyclohydrolase catalytic domain-containing protein n=1 Tax=Chroococcidiopsis sp. CCALA 051 TaxID=869949 RepID=UPI00210120FB|nr:tetrahydrofolate dehydrogenase/cyclohydrolase catalytic domain-containing protein [Chroococcidiopsis sp. CCALA 051]
MSVEQKVAIFKAIGITASQIVIPSNINIEDFQQIIQSVNQNNKVIAAIIQYPVPFQCRSSIQLLSPQKDIDIVREQSNELFQSCATAEGIARIVESYARNSTVAVVGGGGFVGKGVVTYLQQSSINCFVLELYDDKSRLREADIVVSTVGQPGLLTPYILPSHYLVVDAGFTPTADGPKGDVDRSAYSIPQNITPVPGGVGPIEMAILAERLIKMELGVELPKWNYQQLQQQQQQRAEAIAPTVRNLFKQIATSDPTRINSLQSGIAVVEGKYYKLSFNADQNTLSLTRISEELTLIKLNLTKNQIEIARGLTVNDVTKWQQIQTSINLSRQQSIDPDRGIEQ